MKIYFKPRKDSVDPILNNFYIRNSQYNLSWSFTNMGATGNTDIDALEKILRELLNNSDEGFLSLAGSLVFGRAGCHSTMSVRLEILMKYVYAMLYTVLERGGK